MILIALGSNQTGPWGTPEDSVRRALSWLDRGGIRLKRCSSLIMTQPLGVTAQPPFVNAVAEVETALGPEALLARLHLIERRAGRRRTLRWGPRTLDLDLLDYHGLVSPPPARPVLPHPGIPDRIFVLAPIAEIAPSWRHPVTRRSAASMLRALDSTGEGGLL